MRPVYLLGGIVALTLGADIFKSTPHVPKLDEKVNYDYVDERSSLISRIKKTIAYQDTQKEDPTDIRDRLTSPRECGLFIEDLAKIKGLEVFKDEYPHTSGAVSVGPEKNGGDIAVFVTIGNYTTVPSSITFEQAKQYLKIRERK